jgi:hypothetical protein
MLPEKSGFTVRTEDNTSNQQKMESTHVARRQGITAHLVMLEFHDDASDVIAAPARKRSLCQLPSCGLRFLLHPHKRNRILHSEDETLNHGHANVPLTGY